MDDVQTDDEILLKQVYKSLKYSDANLQAVPNTSSHKI